MKLTLHKLSYYVKFRHLQLRKLSLIIVKLPLLQVCIGITLGAVLGVLVGTNGLPIVLVVCLLLRKKLFLTGLVASITLLICALGGASLSAVMNYQMKESILFAKVVETPTQKSFGDSLIVEASDHKRFIVEVPKYSGLHLGDSLKVIIGNFESLEKQNAGYALYLASRQIYGTISSDGIELIEIGSGLGSVMVEVKSALTGVIKSHLLPPESDLLEGILVGEKAALSPDFKEDLQVSGLMHVVAVSGFNVMLIANFLGFLCGIIPRKLVYIITLVVIWLFLFVVGIENLPAQRAVIMLTIMYAGLLIGRRIPMLLCLIYASTLMIVMNPLVWLNISWQLSFAAMLGVVIFANILSKFFNTQSEAGSNLITTGAVLLTTGPISFLSFGSVSLVGLVSNLLVVPTVPIITILGFLSLASGAIQNLANILFQFVGILLKFVVELVRLLGGISSGVVRDPVVAIVVLLIIFSIIWLADFKIFVREIEQQNAEV